MKYDTLWSRFNLLMAPKTDGGEGGAGEAVDTPDTSGAGDMYGKGTPIPTKEKLAKEASAMKDEPVDTDDINADSEKEDFSDDEEKPEGGEDDGDTDLEEKPEGDDTPADLKAQTLRIDPRDLAALRETRSGGQQQDEEKLTPAQIRTLVNPVEIDENSPIVRDMGHEDPKVRAAAMQKFANDVVKNAYSLAKILVGQKEKAFESRLSPLMQQQQQQKLHQTKQAFYSAHKDLVKYDIVVKDAANEVEPVDANGREKSQAQIFKEVAIVSRKKLAALGIKINQPNANHSAENGQRVPQPNKFSNSGRSGGDQHSGKGKPNNADADIYAR